MFSWDLLANAVVAGMLLGGFYAAVSLGVSLTFGLLDVVNIAHPAFVILGAYAAYVMNSSFGLDPILTGVLFTPVFYLLGAGVYRIYYESFERRGEESLRGLVFFFGLLFIIEVGLSLKYGVDYRLVEAAYIGRSIDLGGVGIAFRLLVPFVVGLLMTLALHLFLDLVTCLGQFVDNRVPFEGGQDFRHLVGNVVNRLHQEVTAAHGRVEDLQVEKGLVEGLAEFLVGLVFGAYVFTS